MKMAPVAIEGNLEIQISGTSKLYCYQLTHLMTLFDDRVQMILSRSFAVRLLGNQDFEDF
jgi:hypothetical protein